MAVTAGLIIGGTLTAGSQVANIVNSNKQADDAKAMMKENQDQQTKIYNDAKADQKQAQKDTEGAGAATTVRSQASQFAGDAMKNSGGVQSTVLTSPLGIPDSTNSSLQKKTLLGA